MNTWDGISDSEKRAIQGRIKKIRKSYTKAEQRAELLVRNEEFLKEYVGLMSMANEELPQLGGEEIAELIRRLRKALLDRHFTCFCERWSIKKTWNAEIKTLSKHIRTEPHLHHLRRSTVDVDDWIFLNDSRYPDCLLIMIDPWTTRGDVEAILPRVLKVQRQIFGFSDRGKWSFGDALCWYDLSKKHKLSYRRIANIWKREKSPYIRDIDSYAITVREGIKRIAKYISRAPQKPIAEGPPESSE